jgi:formylglycine-generating enzyme required for sulfatase activity
VLDPWISLAALALELAAAPVLPDRDPGPSPACPEDMRLVEGVHHEDVAHLCTDARDDAKTSHCYGYQEELSILEGTARPIRVCMDQYEAPNRRGARPMVLQSYDSASRFCAKSGKRLCSEREWELACEGPTHLPWAYGWRVNIKLCNSNKGWKKVDFEAFGKTREQARAETERLWQGSPSGRYATCVSPFGIYDMMGNVEEWVSTREGRDFPGALMGGFWAKPWTGCRGTNDAHQPTFAFYETGFRCCQEPEAAGSGKDP